MTNDSDKVCKKADCQVSVTGSCAEGHTPLAACPNYVDRAVEQRDVYDGELEDGETDASSAVERISLPAGDTLTPEEVEQFLRWREGTFVTVVGDSHSGKTTLICSLYDRFLKGNFAGLGFAGSRTLVALERRAHHSRVDSGRDTPETARTSHLEGLRYFHLAVAPAGQPENRTDLLLSDRSGEVYRSARDNSRLVETLLEIPQADRIVLLLDGGRVANPVERNGAIQSVRQTLRVLLDNSALCLSSVVQVVTTKMDLIAASSQKREIDAALGAFYDRMSVDFAPRLKSLSFHSIAARDPTSGFAPGHGLDKLMENWTTPSSVSVPLTHPPLVSQSEFDRLMLRTPTETTR